MFKRVVLFLLLNFVIVLSLSTIVQLLGLGPYIHQHGLNLQALAAFCLIWGMGGAFISLLLSKQLAKWTAGVRIIDPQTHNSDEKALLDDVYMLARKAGLSHMPEVGIFSDDRINAFATGATRSSSLLAVSSGLMRRMNMEEMRAVLGHEISHIANGDMVTMCLLQGVINAFVLFLARILAYLVSGMGRQRSSNSMGSYMLFTFLFEVVFMILGSLIVAAYSRYREFRADAGSAKIYSRDAMIHALEKLQGEEKLTDHIPEEPKQVAALMINAKRHSSWVSLFATHPPLEARIRRLRG